MTSTNTEALLGERIKQRSENVALTAEKRRAKRDINASATESSDYFSEHFNKMKENLDGKLDQRDIVDKSELINYLDEMVEDVGKMQTFLNESSMFLAAFQIKKAQETINLTSELVQTRITELQPKKKFGFRSKKNTVPQKSKIDKVTDNTDGNTLNKTSLSDQLKGKFFFGFKDCVGKTLTKSFEELKSRQLNLQNLVNCKVFALGNPSSLQFANLRDTTVLVGPTSRSAFVKDCYNCTFVLACQQVRIHNTEDTTLYLHVTGAAIIENCKGLSIGPYTLQYEELSDHFKESGLSLEVNKWRNVEDFHWLNENEKSPNFSLIEEECWEKNWI